MPKRLLFRKRFETIKRLFCVIFRLEASGCRAAGEAAATSASAPASLWASCSAAASAAAEALASAGASEEEDSEEGETSAGTAAGEGSNAHSLLFDECAGEKTYILGPVTSAPSGAACAGGAITGAGSGVSGVSRVSWA